MDKVSQSAIENFCAALLLRKYQTWISYEKIWSEVLLWSSTNRHAYAEDENSGRQTSDMYAYISGNLEREKAATLGYKVEDLAWYSLGYLRELVEQVCAGVHSTRLDCAYADVERALYRIVDTGSRATIIGFQAGWLEDEASYNEALKALQETLGGKKPKGL